MLIDTQVEEKKKSWKSGGGERERENTTPNKSKMINPVELSGRSRKVLFKFMYAVTPIPTPTSYGNEED